jgi:hypothetical protein
MFCCLDLPSIGVIQPSEELAVKDGNYSLSCQLEDLGRPEALQYIWTRLDLPLSGKPQ